MRKNCSKKLKQSDIKYFLTINFLTETTQNSANLLGSLLVLHFKLFFAHLSYLYSPMTKLYKYENKLNCSYNGGGLVYLLQSELSRSTLH